jgi:hypothetical protein
MKRYGLLMVFMLLALDTVGNVLLAEPGLDALLIASVPPGVTLELEDTGSAPRLKITNDNTAPVSVTLKEVALDNVSDTRIVYRARMSSQDVESSAYLEMWVVIDGNAYFSRPLNDAFSGTQSERETSTPFFLQADESIESARLGVRFEGPGTVTLQKLVLLDDGESALAWRSRMVAGPRYGIIGSIVGIAMGLGSALWACIVALLAWKGVGRVAVLGGTLGLTAASVVALVAGLYLWSSGWEWAIWNPVILVGGIGLVNFSAAYFVLRWWYGKLEARRISAMDML